jgi:hypothetical protein
MLGAVHVPQLSVPPQPLEIVPQFAPCAAQVVGVQHTPNSATPCDTSCVLSQRRLQQL